MNIYNNHNIMNCEFMSPHINLFCVTRYIFEEIKYIVQKSFLLKLLGTYTKILISRHMKLMHSSFVQSCFFETNVAKRMVK